MFKYLKSCHFKLVINQHTRLFIILAALLTTAFLIILAKLPEYGKRSIKDITVEMQNGVYDLTQIDSFDKCVIHLAPGTTYYPSLYLEPEEVETAVPVAVSQYAEQSADYLSQLFIVRVPNNNTVYTLNFDLSLKHAIRVYVNEELVGQTGNPSTTKKDTEVWENHITCYASPMDGKMEIILQSAQFYNSKGKASLAELTITKTGIKTGSGLSLQVKGFLVMGILFGATIFLLCIFFYNQVPFPLYISLLPVLPLYYGNAC